jgi:iron transport multicopper oxidase
LSASHENAINPIIYGINVNPFVLAYNEIIEVVIYNKITTANSGHPWHLHGHKFQVVARSVQDATNAVYTGQNLHTIPMRRDVAGVRPGGYLVLRFRADTPGVWLLQ